MKQQFLILFFTVISLSLFAQNKSDANIFGDVKSEGEHIPYVTIRIDGTTIGTATDGTGHYSLVNLQTGEYTIIASAVGYRSSSQVVQIINNTVKEINFVLKKDLIGLEEVVVSSDRNAIKRKESTTIINTINPKVFEITQSITLVEGLDFTPGLRTECNCQNCGFSQVRMNGLEGPYTQILINSRPIFSGLAGVYGLELFPTNMIERVEVVRGGGSALFGGNAIAGTINIITKEPTYNGFSLGSAINLTGIEEGMKNPSFDRTLNLNGSIISDNKKAGISFYSMIRDRDPYDANDDGYSEEVLMKNQTIGFSTFYKPTTRTKIILDLFNIHEFRRGGNKFDKLPHETDITEQLDHKITGANIAFDYYTKKYNSLSIYTSAQKVARESYYGAQQDPSAYGKTNDFTNVSGVFYTQNISAINSKMIMGLDHKYSFLNDTKLGVNGENNTNISNQQVNILGSFVQYELKAGIMKIGAGARFDYYNICDRNNEHESITGNVLSPRSNILLDLTDYFQLRLSYAQGYRAPQIYDEDLHIETSGARRITHSNSNDLKQETSHSFNSSLKYANIIGNNNPVQLELIVEGFYTILNDPFANEFSPIDDNGNVEYIRINAEDGAMVYGTNYEANIAFLNSLIFQAGYTYQKSVYETEQQWGEEEISVSKKFMRSPNDYGYLTVSCEPIKNISTSITGIYTGKMLVPHFGLSADSDIPAEMEAMANGDVIIGEKLEISDRFFNIGAKISYNLKISDDYKIQFNMGMQNILNQEQHDHDRGVYRDAGYVYGPHKGRMLTFGIKIGTNF